MADEEQLAILRSGVERWNTWRNAHYQVQPDLPEAHLEAAHLSGALVVRTSPVRARLDGCCVYHIEARDVRLAGAVQTNVCLTLWGRPEIRVHHLDVAQSLTCMLDRGQILQLVDTNTGALIPTIK